MPCNVCHSKNAETVAFLSLAESDRCTLRQKHSDCAEDWVICELCVRQARPNPFFGSTSSRSATSTSTTTAATNATDTATSSATTTATRAVPVKPVKPLRKAKKEKTLKTITVDDRVPQGTLPSRRVAGFKDLWSPAFLLLFVIVFNACHVHL